MLERHKATARRWSEELWNQGILTVADEIVAADYVRHDAGSPFPVLGREDVKRSVTWLRESLADVHIEIEDMVAEGDRVVSRYTVTGTDSLGYLGNPPTGRAISTSAIQIFRFENGLIAESWAVRDDLAPLVQMGMIDPETVGRE